MIWYSVLAVLAERRLHQQISVKIR